MESNQKKKREEKKKLQIINFLNIGVSDGSEENHHFCGHEGDDGKLTLNYLIDAVISPMWSLRNKLPTSGPTQPKTPQEHYIYRSTAQPVTKTSGTQEWRSKVLSRCGATLSGTSYGVHWVPKALMYGSS